MWIYIKVFLSQLEATEEFLPLPIFKNVSYKNLYRAYYMPLF